MAKTDDNAPSTSEKSKPKWYRRKRFWRRFITLTILLPVLLFSIVIGVVYAKQDEVVQHLIEDVNEDFTGLLEVEGSHISPFETFPYICIDLEHVRVWENKEKNTTAIMDVEEVFLGFELWDIISGDMTIKEIKLKNGHLDLIQHVDGEFNIAKALSTEKEIEDPSEEFHLDLHEIILEEIDLHKLNEADSLLVDAYIFDADAIFSSQPEHLYASLDSRFELNLIKGGDTTFLKHKHLDVDTEFDFLKGDDILTIQPTTVHIEGSEFNMQGDIDFLDDVNVNFTFDGNKKDFSLLFAMAPEEIIPVLERYENEGELVFEATVKGKTINGHSPAIEATFGCKNAFFNNTVVNRSVEDLNFLGHFTNGAERDITTMEITVEDFRATPESGEMEANLSVKNFNDPEINLQMKSVFELDFLTEFFEVEGLEDMHGHVEMTMNFHDIVNLQYPEHSIQKLNESYFTQILVEDLGFTSASKQLTLQDLDLYAEITGHEAHIDYLDVQFGKSDVHITGSIDDLPAILHHTDIDVDTRLKITSNFIDLYELTGGDSTAFNEQIKNLALDLDFKSSARDFTEFKNLPQGEFFIENLYADMQHYPHRLHDFHADIKIDEDDFHVIDFKGMIDDSDFLFSGELEHYDLWFMEHPIGDTKIDFNLTSKQMRLEDLFSYKGENYVPEDYRHEEFDDLNLHGHVDLHFKDGEGLYSTDAYIDNFESTMKVHPLRFEDFYGRVHYEKDHLVVEDFHGRLGKSDFKTTLHYYLGDDEAIKLRDNHFSLKSGRLDFDQLFAWSPPPAGAETEATVDHDAGFNIYEVPFTDMTFDIDIAHLNYHRYLIDNVKARFHTTPDHYINFDQCDLEAAGGSFHVEGYFNGSDPDLIYFSPDMTVKDVDLDKLLFKFENFGQDHLVSENLHGQFSGDITGKIHMHNDMVPKIDDSEIHMDIHVVNGKLENFALFEVFADYFRDKNLSSVRFDTLDNHIDLTNGVLNIPNMTINSSIGFMDFAGTQDMDLNFEYYVKVPWKVVTDAASSKLFGKRRGEVDPDQVDEIQYANDSKRTRYVNLKMKGNPDDYSVSLGKKKDR